MAPSNIFRKLFGLRYMIMKKSWVLRIIRVRASLFYNSESQTIALIGHGMKMAHYNIKFCNREILDYAA